MRFGSILIFCLFALISLGIGCAAARDAQTTDAVPQEVVEQVQVVEQRTIKEDAVITEGIVLVEAQEAELNIVEEPSVFTQTLSATNFAFSPSAITVKAGMPVELTVTDLEGEHTFVVEELGIEESLSLGGVVAFTAPTAPGRYTFHCGVGPNRRLGMEGTLIVE